ncbi:MAG: cyclic nucleotide-binding domain-containing protein [Leptospiraceae bacterium]|nr:cyclic nucleotide-binding domain-containing protein [Leptospiraceae bacterium]
MSGPVIRTYKSGSIVYFEKDKADDIYVLQSGRIVLTYMSVDGKTEIKEDVKLGEFFGVKSSLGRYPREETAQVVGSASVLVFKMANFELFVAQKTHLILKMMKVFSSQLRQIHGKVREQLGQYGDLKSPSYELMNVAEVFHKAGNFDHARYAYERYIAHYPEGNYAGRAKELLNLAKKSSMFPLNMPELNYEPEKRSFSPNAPTANQGSASKAFKESYDKASQFFDNSKYEEAAVIYKSLIDMKEVKNPEEAKIVERSNFQYGICLSFQSKLDEAYSALSNYVKKFPKGEKVKESIFNLASITEKKGEKDKAVMLYNKVLSLQPEDSLTNEAKEKIASLKG